MSENNILREFYNFLVSEGYEGVEYCIGGYWIYSYSSNKYLWRPPICTQIKRDTVIGKSNTGGKIEAFVNSSGKITIKRMEWPYKQLRPSKVTAWGRFMKIRKSWESLGE